MSALCAVNSPCHRLGFFVTGVVVRSRFSSLWANFSCTTRSNARKYARCARCHRRESPHTSKPLGRRQDGDNDKAILPPAGFSTTSRLKQRRLRAPEGRRETGEEPVDTGLRWREVQDSFVRSKEQEAAYVDGIGAATIPTVAPPLMLYVWTSAESQGCVVGVVGLGLVHSFVHNVEFTT